MFEAEETTLMMRPCPHCRIPGMTACMMMYGPRTWMACACHHSSGSTSSTGPKGRSTPALLTAIVIRPNCASIRRMAASTATRSVTSPGSTMARPPDDSIRSATSRSCCSLRASSPTGAPAAARSMATCLPIPRPLPVTIATSPFSIICASPSSCTRSRPGARRSMPQKLLCTEAPKVRGGSTIALVSRKLSSVG